MAFEEPYVPSGYSGQQTYGAAAAYAQQHQGYVPHSVMQEGTVTYQNGQPGYYAKYDTPQGSSTEWTPLNYNQAQAQAYQGGGGYSGGGGGGGAMDPALAAATNLSAKIRSNAAASALAKREQAAIQYGSAEGLQNVLGNDYATVAQQAANNPYSVLGNLSTQYNQGLQTLEDQLNKANLFYSGYRGQQLENAGNQYQQARYNAGTSFQGTLNDIADQLAQALMQADETDMQAALNAQYWGGGGGDSGYGAPAPGGANVMNPASVVNYFSRYVNPTGAPVSYTPGYSSVGSSYGPRGAISIPTRVSGKRRTIGGV